MNSLYGEQIRKDNEEKFASKSEHWMMTVYDERVNFFGKYLMVNILLKRLMTQDWKMKLKT